MSSRRKRKSPVSTQSSSPTYAQLAYNQELAMATQEDLERDEMDAPLLGRRQGKYGVEEPEVDDDPFDQEKQEEADVEERPSFVSTGGGGSGGTTGVADVMSADGYMRLASAEMDAACLVKESPRQSRNPNSYHPQYGLRIDHPTPSAVGDFWPVFHKQRRLFSFKNLSFLSNTSSNGKDE